MDERITAALEVGGESSSGGAIRLTQKNWGMSSNNRNLTLLRKFVKILRNFSENKGRLLYHVPVNFIKCTILIERGKRTVLLLLAKPNANDKSL